MLLEFLQAYPHCKEATSVSIRRVTGVTEHGANWILDTYDSGRALRDHCDTAIALIVPIVQHHFDIAPDA
jgi:hypothetical protein